MLKQNKKYFFILTFFLVILIFGFISGPVLASEDPDDDDPEDPGDDDPEDFDDDDPEDFDDDNDGIDDDFEELNKRNIEFEISDNEIQIESHLRNGENIDEIQIKIKLESEGLSIEVSYEEEYDSGSESELEFDVEFHEIIEYLDSNDNGVYDSEVDSELQTIPFDEFYPIDYSSSKISGDSDLHYFRVETKDGIFKAHIYFLEEFSIVNNSLITPNQIKINFEITNFPYLNGNSQLALYAKLESELEFEEEDDTEDEENGFAENEQGLITTINQYTGIFTWQENATIDGISKKVLVSSIETDDHDEDEQKIFFNYLHGEHIFHDPKVGIEGLLIFKKASFPFTAIIIIISIIAALSISVAYSVYFFTHNRHPSTVWDDKRKFTKLPSSVKIQIFEEENSINKLIELGDVNITAVSEEFFEEIKNLDMDANEKQEFLEEMLSLSPNERDSILNKILKKNIQTQ
ncbi:hypothetical protein LCGC14_1663790 [marine sediment metagenome]|uniref:Uncharacterized protein n=1 Tax=marine sediment metagenome TaxID=412755 RepID=A0A0F9HTB9_9ZZZZ